jgi:GntR family transcriptional repressor for pyruvate dehydrogenase complex
LDQCWQLVIPVRLWTVQLKVSDTVHAYLRDAILADDLAPGEAVPSERELSERLGVNRHAVREAINRLQQARLVQVSHGGATRVLDWRATGGLDLITDLVRDHSAQIDAGLMRSIAEMRACIGIDAARRCAERADAATREEAAGLTLAAAATGDLAARTAANTALWVQLVEGSENLAYRLALNTLVEGVSTYPELDALLNAPGEDAADYDELARALRAGHGADTAAAARTLLERPLPAQAGAAADSNAIAAA